LEVQAILKEIQRIVEETAPGAEAGFAYGMPAYKLNGKPLIYFAAYKNHIGLYATPNAHAHFSQELSAYKQGKGSVQFPLAQPMPFGLIRRIVAFNAKNLC
jgi:uncharacterized protein YdhG (YjbR/CyaY superfamily)